MNHISPHSEEYQVVLYKAPVKPLTLKGHLQVSGDETSSALPQTPRTQRISELEKKLAEQEKEREEQRKQIERLTATMEAMLKDGKKYHYSPKATHFLKTPLNPNPIVQQSFNLNPQQKNFLQLAPAMFREALQTLLEALQNTGLLQGALKDHKIALASNMTSLAYYDQEDSKIFVDEQILSLPSLLGAQSLNQEQLKALLRQVLLHELMRALGYGGPTKELDLALMELDLYYDFFGFTGLANLRQAFNILYKNNFLLQDVQGQSGKIDWVHSVELFEQSKDLGNQGTLLEQSIAQNILISLAA